MINGFVYNHFCNCTCCHDLTQHGTNRHTLMYKMALGGTGRYVQAREPYNFKPDGPLTAEFVVRVPVCQLASDLKLVGPVGFEPTTCGLTAPGPALHSRSQHGSNLT